MPPTSSNKAAMSSSQCIPRMYFRSSSDRVSTVDRSALCECLYIVLLSLSTGCSHVVSVKVLRCCLLVSYVRNERVYDVLWYSAKVVVDAESSRCHHEVVCVCGKYLVFSREDFLSVRRSKELPHLPCLNNFQVFC